MKISRWFIIIGCSALLVGCESKKSREEIVEIGSTAEPAAVESTSDVGVEPSSDAGSEEGASDAGTTTAFANTMLPGTPYDEEHTKLEIFYRAENEGEVTLFRSAGDSVGPSGRFVAEPDSKLEIRESVVFVREPRRLDVKKDYRFPATKYDMMRGKFRDDVLLDLKKGDPVYLLKYAGEGTCFVGYKSVIYHVPCPAVELFESEGWDGEPQPVQVEWWVRVAEKGARGWVQVDGTRLVHNVVESK